jgi:hypothetical protein
MMKNVILSFKKSFSNKKIITILIILLCVFLLISVLRFFNLYEGYSEQSIQVANMINGSMDVAGEVIDQVDTSKISNLTTKIANKINSGNPQELINAYTSVTPSSTISMTPSSTISMTPSSTISMTPSSTTSVTPSSTISMTPSSTTSVTPSSTTSVTPSSTISVTPSSTTSVTPSSTISMTPSSTTLPTSTGSVTSFDAIKYDY